MPEMIGKASQEEELNRTVRIRIDVLERIAELEAEFKRETKRDPKRQSDIIREITGLRRTLETVQYDEKNLRGRLDSG